MDTSLERVDEMDSGHKSVKIANMIGVYDDSS